MVVGSRLWLWVVICGIEWLSVVSSSDVKGVVLVEVQGWFEMVWGGARGA